MSRLRLSFATVALAALASFTPAIAQQPAVKTTPGVPAKPAQGVDNPSANTELTRPNQTERSGRPGAAGQANQSSAQGNRQNATDQAHTQHVTVKQAIVKKLQKSNTAEVELAQLAQQKSDNQELRKFTQMVIQDHQALNQQLEKLEQLSNSSRTTGQQNELKNAHPTATASSSINDNYVPQQLCQIMDQACQNTLQMTKESLQKYEGQDFLMAYLGQQCVAHTMMIAELKAIQSNGPDELKEVTQQAIGKAESHLSQAKQLAQKFKDTDNTQKR